MKLARADLGYTGEKARQAAQDNGIELQVVKLPEAKNGFVLRPRRWVVERSFDWLARFRQAGGIAHLRRHSALMRCRKNPGGPNGGVANLPCRCVRFTVPLEVRDGTPSWFARTAVAVGFGGPWHVEFWLIFWSSLFPSHKPVDHAEAKATSAANLKEPWSHGGAAR